jgi:hypothetical protein
MVRRSARLRHEAPDEDGEENEGIYQKNGQETVENLAKRTYELIKEKLVNNRENSNSDVTVEKEGGQEKAVDFISISSRVKDHVSK